MFFLTAGAALAGPTIDLDYIELDCNGHGLCETCQNTCLQEGFTRGGGCYGYAQCCCVKN